VTPESYSLDFCAKPPYNAKANDRLKVPPIDTPAPPEGIRTILYKQAGGKPEALAMTREGLFSIIYGNLYNSNKDREE
jgi:hypothetical protein